MNKVKTNGCSNLYDLTYGGDIPKGEAAFIAQMMLQYQESDKNAAVRRQKQIIASGRSYIENERD